MPMPKQSEYVEFDGPDPSTWDPRRAMRIVEEFKRRLGWREPRRIARGSEIFGLGTPPTEMFLLARGIASLHYRLSDGREALFLLAYPGDLLGVTNPEPNVPTQTSAAAVVPCEVYRLDMQHLHRTDPDGSIAAMINRSLRAQIARRTKALAELLALSPAERLEGHLCELAEVLGVNTGKGPIRIPVPLKDHEMARLLGLSERQFKRVKTEMQAAGKITVEGARIFTLPQC